MNRADKRRPSLLSSSVEDYVKAIYVLEQRGEGAAVSTNKLAARLGVTAPAASAMIKKLAAHGYVRYVRYRGVKLTPLGSQIALEVLRHHRLLELFLVETLGVPWDRVHAEAEVLEHVLSEGLEATIAARLGEPTRDPHGDPIPSPDGTVLEAPSVPLGSLEVGASGTFVRVSDRDPSMLRYLADRRIRPGDRLEVVDRDPLGGPMVVRAEGEIHVLDLDLAAAMRVEVDP